MVVLALDAMGGDHAPLVVLQGAFHFFQKNKDIRFLIFGDRELIMPIMSAYDQKFINACVVRHTSEQIKSEDQPSKVVRNKNTSMCMAIDSVVNHDADAVVSSGNTGAFMALALLRLGRCGGVDRPAIVASLPTKKNTPCLFLDLGANVTATTRNLVQYAIMGGVFSRIVHAVRNPKIGLLNIGEEENKGRKELADAAAVLNKYFPKTFSGFIEGNKIYDGDVDVIVTDGFSGNIALKVLEGTVQFFSMKVKEAFASSILSSIGYLFSFFSFRRLKNLVDPRLYNGAVFLGVNGVAVKSHGGTDEEGFSNALRVAYCMVKNDFVSRVTSELELIDFSDVDI